MAVIAATRLALLQRLYAKSRDRLPNDARVFQIVFLSGLLTTGVLLRDFSVQPLQIVLAFAAGFATQAFWLRRLGLQQKGLLSAIVTCCGLSLLLRSDTLWAHPLAAALAMSSKFVLRISGKHLHNPANLGVIAAITLLPGTWVSPGHLTILLVWRCRRPSIEKRSIHPSVSPRVFDKTGWPGRSN